MNALPTRANRADPLDAGVCVGVVWACATAAGVMKTAASPTPAKRNDVVLS
jgi:hypothetical protein